MGDISNHSPGRFARSYISIFDHHEQNARDVFVADYVTSGEILSQHGLPVVEVPPTDYDFVYDISRGLVCRHSRNLWVSGTVTGHDLYIDHGCAGNELAGLLNRHMVPFNTMAKSAAKSLAAIARNYVIPSFSLDFDQIVSTKTPKVRRRYKTWEKRTHLSYLVKAFVKAEKKSDPNKAPRLIQSYSPGVNLAFAMCYQEYERQLMLIEQNGLRVFAKGRNCKQRAQDLLQHYNAGRHYVYLIDHKHFDSLINLFHVLLKYGIYLASNPDPRFKHLLDNMVCRKGITSGGIFYQFVARVASGTQDTGGGNSLLNAMFLDYAFKGCDYTKYVDGDDSVVFSSTPAPGAISNLVKLGLESVVNCVHDIYSIEFCQSKIMMLQDGPCMVRTPERALARLLVSPSGSPATDYNQQLSYCEWRVSNGVPVIADLLKLNSGHFKWKDCIEYRVMRDMRCRPKYKLSTQCNTSQFMDMFGVAIAGKHGKFNPRCPCHLGIRRKPGKNGLRYIVYRV